MRYVAYFRVSTVRQGKSGLGLKDQEQMVFSRIKTDDEVIAQFSEIETGTAKKMRPELQKAVKLCKQKKATLIVARLDRLHRNVATMQALLDSGIDIVFCDFPGANRMTIQILAVLAEYEAINISRNTRAALAQCKIYGTKSGRPPGDAGGWKGRETAQRVAPYAYYRKFLDYPANRMAYAFIQQLTATNKLSSKKIAQSLNVNGYLTHTGKIWRSKEVNKLKYTFQSEVVKRKVREYDDWKIEAAAKREEKYLLPHYKDRNPAFQQHLDEHSVL